MEVLLIRTQKLFAFGWIFILAGCSNGDNTQQTPKEKITGLETSGAIPKLERSTDIAGIDANANGVRDDIEAYITTNYTSTPQRAAAMQSAKALQRALLVDTTNITAVKEVNRKISQADHCIYLRFDGSNSSKEPAQVSQEIESMTTNTKGRLKAYLAYSKALDGTSWAMPEGDTCE